MNTETNETLEKQKNFEEYYQRRRVQEKENFKRKLSGGILTTILSIILGIPALLLYLFLSLLATAFCIALGLWLFSILFK